jgi:hypothetical protein
MNWKIVLQLSLFGLIMAFGTISLIKTPLEEMPFWLAIFVFCAYIIAKRCAGSYFLNGFMVSIFNCFWILLVHLIFFHTFMQNHQMAANSGMPASMATHPRLVMIVFGAIIGIVSGLVLGLFAFIASKIVKKSMPAV